MKSIDRDLLLHIKLQWYYYWNPDDGLTIAYSNINLREFFMVQLEPPSKTLSFI